MKEFVDNLVVLIPCIFVLAFAAYLAYHYIKEQEISDKDYREWCEENNVEYEYECEYEEE